MSKLQKMKALGQKRQQTRWPGYASVGDYYEGRYESDFVSPYTKSAKNLDSQIMVLLQDWSSHDSINSGFHSDVEKKGHYPGLPTNKRLIELLDGTFEVKLSEIFATNLFPFIKQGGISATIPRSVLKSAAVEFAIPQIEIVQPKLVICLGLATFQAMQEACEIERADRMDAAIKCPFDFGNTRIWCQAHTGARGQNNRGRKLATSDWKQMKDDVQIKIAR